MKSEDASKRTTRLTKDGDIYSITLTEEIITRLGWSVDDLLKVEITFPLWNEEDEGKGLLLNRVK
jgi:hypothetical protein